jgi:hypothetical protein
MRDQVLHLKFEALCHISWCAGFCCEHFSDPNHTPSWRTTACRRLWLLIHYICVLLYIEAFYFILNFRIRHAVVTRGLQELNS